MLQQIDFPQDPLMEGLIHDLFHLSKAQLWGMRIWIHGHLLKEEFTIRIQEVFLTY